MTELLKYGEFLYAAVQRHSDGRYVRILKLRADTLEKVAEFNDDPVAYVTSGGIVVMNRKESEKRNL